MAAARTSVETQGPFQVPCKKGDHGHSHRDRRERASHSRGHKDTFPTGNSEGDLGKQVFAGIIKLILKGDNPRFRLNVKSNDRWSYKKRRKHRDTQEEEGTQVIGRWREIAVRSQAKQG